MIAVKFYDDRFYDNLYYSKVGGLSVTEVNHLELELLFLLDFGLSVDDSTFGVYEGELVRPARFQQQQQRAAHSAALVRKRTSSLEAKPEGFRA